MTTAGRVVTEFVVDDTAFSAGVRRAQATLDGLPKSIQKNTREFEQFGQFAKRAGNEMGLGIGGGTFQAATALASGAGALRAYTVQVTTATAASGAFTAAQLRMAVATKVSGAALAAIGGPIGLAVIGGIVAIGKAYEWSSNREEKWAKDQVKHFEEVGAAADKLRERITKSIVAQKDLDRDASNARGQLGAFTRGGSDGLEAEKRRQEIADKTRAAVIALRPEWAKFDDDVIRTHENYGKIHSAIASSVVAVDRLKTAQDEAARGAKLHADLMKEIADSTARFSAEAAEAGLKALKPWLDAVKLLDGQMNGSIPIDMSGNEAAIARGTGVGPLDMNAETAEYRESLREQASEMSMAMDALAAVVSGDAAGATSAIMRGVEQLSGAAPGVVQFFAAIGQGFTNLVNGGAAKDRDQFFSAMVRLQQLQQSQMSQAEVREKELARARTDGERAILRQIHLLEDEAEARDRAAEAARAQVEALDREREARIRIARTMGNDQFADGLEFGQGLAEAVMNGIHAVAAFLAEWMDKQRAKEAQRDTFTLPDDLNKRGRGEPLNPKGRRPFGGTTRFGDETPAIVPGEDVFGPTGIDTSQLGGGGGSSGPTEIARSLATMRADQSDRLIGIVSTHTALLRQISRHTGMTANRGVLFADSINDDTNRSSYLGGDAAA